MTDRNPIERTDRSAWPAKVRRMVEMIEEAGNAVTVETDAKDPAPGLIEPYTFWWIKFESVERHPLLSSAGRASFRTRKGRTRFLGGSIWSLTADKRFRTYSDARIKVEVYTTTPRS